MLFGVTLPLETDLSDAAGNRFGTDDGNGNFHADGTAIDYPTGQTPPPAVYTTPRPKPFQLIASANVPTRVAPCIQVRLDDLTSLAQASAAADANLGTIGTNRTADPAWTYGTGLE